MSARLSFNMGPGGLTLIRQSFVTVAVLAAVLGFFVSGGVPAAEEEATLSQVRMLSCRKADPAPVIDGRLDDACWRQAEPASEFSENKTGKPAEVQSVAFAAYDSEKVYFAFWCPEPDTADLVARATMHDDVELWRRDDAVEVVLDPNHDCQDYFRLARNAAGAHCDDRGDIYGGFDPEWNPEWESAVQVGEGEWGCEMAIPFAQLGVTAPKEGDIWGLNLNRYRYAGSPNERSSWSPIGPAVRNPEILGDLFFGQPSCCLTGIGSRWFGGSHNQLLLHIRNLTDRLLQTRVVLESNQPEGPWMSWGEEVTVSSKKEASVEIGYEIPGQRSQLSLRIMNKESGQQLYSATYYHASPFGVNQIKEEALAIARAARPPADGLLTARWLGVETRRQRLDDDLEKIGRENVFPLNVKLRAVEQTLSQERVAAGLLRGQVPESGSEFSLAALAGDPRVEVVWIARFRTWGPSLQKGRGFGDVCVYFAGIPLGKVNEKIRPSAEAARARVESERADALTRFGVEISDFAWNGYQGVRATAGEHFMWLAKGNSTLWLGGASPEIVEMLLTKTAAREPISAEDVEQMRRSVPMPVQVSELARILGLDYKGPVIMVGENASRMELSAAHELRAALGGTIRQGGEPGQGAPLVLLGTPLSNPAVASLLAEVKLDKGGLLTVRENQGVPTVIVTGDHPTGVAEAAKSLIAVVEVLKEKRMFVGDLHMHSTYSDGSTSPTIVCESTMANYMDFMSLTDHGTIQGDEELLAKAKESGLDYPIIVGEEVTMPAAHIVAIGVSHVIPQSEEPGRVPQIIHEAGGVAILAHPGDPKSEWAKSALEKGVASGLDAFEARYDTPWYYPKWKAAERLPSMVSSTDSHSGTFEGLTGMWSTLVFAEDDSPEAIVAAVRNGDCLGYTDGNLYGPDRLIRVFNALISDGAYLESQHLERLRHRMSTVPKE